MAAPSRAFAVAAVLALAVSVPGAAEASLRSDAEGYASAFGGHLSTLVHEAAVTDALTEAYASYTYAAPGGSTRDAFDSILSSLSDKVASRNAAVRQIQSSAALLFSEGAPTQPDGTSECCEVRDSTVEYNSFFQAEVDMTSSCLRYAEGTRNSESVIADTEYMEQVFEDLFDETPTLKWSYFGSDEGGFRIFPAKQRGSCDDYDPRFRPWYVSAATPEAKDIVIVIDSSGSMEGTRMSKAKEAAKVVLSTLNPRDYVALVEFDTVARTAEGCFNDGMAVASPQNVAELKSFVDSSVSADGGTGYVAALNKAFDLLESGVHGDSGGDKAILFLTDGEPSDNDSDIFDLLNRRNADDSVSLLTFLLGNANVGTLLRDMAQQNAGTYLAIPDSGDLRAAMGRYYSFFSNPTEDQAVVYAPPYFDASGLGIITTAALPVVHGGDLKGVVGVDLTLEDLVADAALFGGGDSKSYAFITDDLGNVLVHPLLPRPSAVTSPPVVLHISQLEKSAGFSEVEAGMRAGQTGQKVLDAESVTPRGLSRTEGVVSETFAATYFYAPVPDSPFSLCVVVAHSDEELPRLDNVPKPDFDEAFVYHRLDLLSESTCDDDYICDDCSQFETKSSAQASSVKFAPGVFTDSTYYSQKEESSNIVRSFVNWLAADADTGSPPTAMHDAERIKRDVWATAPADAAYRASTGVMDRVLWRYVATPSGVFRSFPAHPSSSTYDPRIRPWWYRALAHPEAMAVSTPYADASAGATVVTVSNIIRRSDSGAAPLEAVTGVDFTLGNLQAIMDSVFDCRAGGLMCVLVDSSGLLVLNDDLLFNENLATSDLFIGDVYPAIAIDLRDQGVLSPAPCNDFQDQSAVMVYTLETSSAVSRQGPGRCSDEDTEYALAPIEGTNIFLLAVTVSDTCECVSDRDDDAPSNGFAEELDFEQCPVEFDLSTAQRANPTCPPSASSGSSYYEIERATAGTPECFQASCSAITSASACLETLGCHLCSEADPSVEADCRSDACDALAASNVRPEPQCGAYNPDETKPGEVSASSSAAAGAAGIIATVALANLLA